MDTDYDHEFLATPPPLHLINANGDNDAMAKSLKRTDPYWHCVICYRWVE